MLHIFSYLSAHLDAFVFNWQRRHYSVSISASPDCETMARGAQEQGFLVMRRPGLKGAETLTLIIHATLGFSFHSACTV